jgi:prefoldin subunit 5
MNNGGISMAGFKRTASCVKCGGVIIKIKQRTGGAIFQCLDCDNDLNEVKCDKYQTFSTICEKCGAETFKVRITPGEKDSKNEHWIPECASCADIPKLVNIDNEGNLIDEEERKLLIKEDGIRKAKCEKCGSIDFKIKQSVGGVIFCCTKCDNKLEEVEYEKYQTLLPSCSKCGEDIFKVIIEQDKEDDTIERWSPECIKCKGTPKSVYIDNGYKLINEDERRMLIMKDRIEELEAEVEDNEETINELESEAEDLNNTIEEKDYKIYRLKEKLEHAEQFISNLEREISDLQDEASNLNNKISDLEWQLDR